MFEVAVIDYWGRHEECPLFGGDLSRMEFCCAQMLTERQTYDWIMLMNDAHPRSAPKAKLSWRIARMVRRREAYDLIGNDSDAAPPSPPSPKPKPPKRIKKNCPLEIQIRRAENGGESVEQISPDEETPHLELKVLNLLEACYLNDNLSSVELQVCARPLPAKRARADCAFVFAREFLSGCCLWPFTSSMT